MRPERKAGADTDGKIKGRLIKDWSITYEDSNSICISASRKHKKIIDEIAKTNDVELIDATQTVEKDLSEYDLIGFASGVYGGKFHQSVLKFASVNLTDNKNVFLICTYGGRPVFKSIEQVIAYKHDNIVGRFSCKGFDTFGPFKLIGGVSKGHPDEKDLAAAVEFYNGLTDSQCF